MGFALFWGTAFCSLLMTAASGRWRRGQWITLDLYSHVTATMQREAAAAMDEVLR